MKTTREVMDIVHVYAELGSYRATAAACGTTHRTVKRVLERREQQLALAESGQPVPKRVRNTEVVTAVIAERVQATDGRISAKRLLPVAKTAG